MTLTELRYIVAVAQERHFGRAAQRCHVSQPTLSIAIKKLEEELALSLFDRSSNEVITTEAGGRIVAQARRVLDEADVIRQLASEEQNELDGAFKLGLIFTVAPYLLPKLILSLREIAPNMPLMLEENYTHMLTESLKRGDLDAIIVAEPFQETGLLTEPLYDEPFFVIVPKGHPFEELDAVTQHELAQEQVLLLTEGNCTARQRACRLQRIGGQAENQRPDQYAAGQLHQYHPPYGGQRPGHQRIAGHRADRKRPLAVQHHPVCRKSADPARGACLPPQLRPSQGIGGDT